MRTRPQLSLISNKYICNLCNGPIVRIQPGALGLRCLCCRSTYIHRSICHVFEQLVTDKNSTIYELSVHGAFYKYLRKRFRYLSASDFKENVPLGTMFDGNLIQNVEKLSFFPESFDVVTATEVFEHVANDLMGFSEINRVLKPKGKFIFTVPLNTSAETIVRARRKEDGNVEHLLAPEYHGDYLRNGILTFRTYGTDIQKILNEAGFQDVTIYNVTSPGNVVKPVICCIK